MPLSQRVELRWRSASPLFVREGHQNKRLCHPERSEGSMRLDLVIARSLATKQSLGENRARSPSFLDPQGGARGGYALIASLFAVGFKFLFFYPLYYPCWFLFSCYTEGMAQQFVVPQFLDVESKIIGPITGRQFLILLAVILVEFFIYSLFSSIIIFLLLGIPVLVIGVVFAFARVNGRPFHYIALNMVQTLRKPMLRVWDKTLLDSDLKMRLKKDVEVLPPPVPVKRGLERSKLSELALVVNTGGVYESGVDQEILIDPVTSKQLL